MCLAHAAKCTICTRVREHSHCCRLRQSEKFAVAEHVLSSVDHHVLFEETKILSSVNAYYPQLHVESTVIFKHGSIAMNRRGVSLLLNMACCGPKPSDSSWLMLLSSLDHAGTKVYISGHCQTKYRVSTLSLIHI